MIIDREKVIKGLEVHTDLLGGNCNVCPYHSDTGFWPQCASRLLKDALELLKEQKPIQVDTKVIGTFNGDMEVYCCRDCRTILDSAFHFCPCCGQEVKWE